MLDLYWLLLRATLFTWVMTLMTDFRENEFEDAERLEGWGYSFGFLIRQTMVTCEVLNGKFKLRS